MVEHDEQLSVLLVRYEDVEVVQDETLLLHEELVHNEVMVEHDEHDLQVWLVHHDDDDEQVLMVEMQVQVPEYEVMVELVQLTLFHELL